MGVRPQRKLGEQMRQVRKRATVSSANTSGKPGSAGAEQSGWQRVRHRFLREHRCRTQGRDAPKTPLPHAGLLCTSRLVEHVLVLKGDVMRCTMQ
eukprot:COSAG04_NODE_1713_length_5822_cov_50.309977_3_plen_95_part_00